MDGNLVNGTVPVRATGALDRVARTRHSGRLVGTAIAHQRRILRAAISGELQVKQVVRANTINEALRDAVSSGLVLEHDASDVNRVRVELRARRDGVVAGLETGDGGDDEIEGNGPGGGVLGGWRGSDVVAGSELKDFADFEATIGNDSCVLILGLIELAKVCLGLGSRGELSEGTEDLATGDGTDIDVVAKDSGVGRGDGERDLSESGIKRLDTNDGIGLVVKSKSTKEPNDLDIRI